jgi:hypothetical protein
MRDNGLDEAEMRDLDIVGVVQDVLGLERFQTAALALACIIDQHINAAPRLGDLVHESPDGRRVADVQRDGDDVAGPERTHLLGDDTERFW